MKKFLLSMALFAASVGAWATDGVTAKVSGSTLNIALTNESSYCAFQMDIALPEGVSATAFEAVSDRLSQEGSDTEIGGTKFIVAYNQIDAENNIWRVIAYNLNNEPIAGTSGDNIIKITLSESVEDPSVIQVSNNVFVTEALAAETLEDIQAESGVLKGDVNKSGDVNLNDVNALVDILLYGIDSDQCKAYDKDAADVNGNGEINLNDLTALLDIILNN